MEKKSVEITEKYDAIIIGFGKGGKTLAKALGDAGKKTVLIERSNKMYGGTCPNVGCVPTKSLVYRAGLISAGDGSFEDKARAYKEAVEHKNSLTGKLRERNYQKLTNHPNITVMDGTARFVSSHDVEVERDGKTVKLTGKQIFIDTGSSAFVPPIDGVKGNPYVYTSETLLEQKELPKNLVIIGGGYIGVEFSSIYASFGSKVSILQDGDVFLPREDADIAGAVRKSLSGRGIDVLTGVKVKAVEQAEGRAAVVFEDREGVRKLEADAVLIATGRRPNTKELNLEAAGIEVNARGGIITDDSMMTTAPDVYAMGDVTGGLQFTYISLDDSRIVKSKILGDGSYTLKDRGAVPYSVFLAPAFSRVGLSEKDARDAGYQVKIATVSASEIVKSKVLEQPDGLLKAVIDEKTGLILGAHLFCEESYELINIIKMAMDAKLPYSVLRDIIFTHPTKAESLNELFAV